MQLDLREDRVVGAHVHEGLDDFPWNSTHGSDEQPLKSGAHFEDQGDDELEDGQVQLKSGLEFADINMLKPGFKRVEKSSINNPESAQNKHTRTCHEAQDENSRHVSMCSVGYNRQKHLLGA